MDLSQAGRFFLRSVGNIHRQGAKKNIFLFATPRGGSTWVMEIIASQPGMKYYDEPFNIRRANVRKAGLFADWDQLMPEAGQRERIFGFLRALERNRYRYMNPPPFRKNHRFLTDRIVFKIHELDHLINDVERSFDAHIVYLLRHPIATTISRNVYPRLDNYLRSRYYRDYIGSERHAQIERLVAKGSKLQQGMASWCFENLLPLKHADASGWLTLSYEEILLNPRKTCALMRDRLQLDDMDAMLASVDQPAANIAMSDRSTLDVLKERDDERRRLGMVQKWTRKIGPQDERQAFEVLELFGIDAYREGRLVADDRYLHFDDTALKVGDGEQRQAANA